MRSSYGLPPQSPLMESTNVCPYPVEPWKLITTTTKPGARTSAGFQREDQSSPNAPCGPPWMRKRSGILLLGVEAGGLSRKPFDLVALRAFEPEGFERGHVDMGEDGVTQVRELVHFWYRTLRQRFFGLSEEHRFQLFKTELPKIRVWR